MMTADDAGYAKPLPSVTAEGAPFWEAARRGALATQHCLACDRQQFPPRRLCMHCGARELDWRTVSSRGEIYSFTIVHRAPEPSFLADVPYVVAVIDLPEGGRMMTNIIDCPPGQVRVGMQVEAVFEAVNSDVTLIKFRPVGAKDA
jgi:uncharacterized OB-fold protein